MTKKLSWGEENALRSHQAAPWNIQMWVVPSPQEPGTYLLSSATHPDSIRIETVQQQCPNALVKLEFEGDPAEAFRLLCEAMEESVPGIEVRRLGPLQVEFWRDGAKFGKIEISEVEEVS